MNDTDKLEAKIIAYLNKLENDSFNQNNQQIDNNKKNLLSDIKKKYDEADKNQKECQKLIKEISKEDKEEQNLLLLEVENLEKYKKEIIEKVKEIIVGENPQKPQEQNIILEIRAGIGGEEAGLFVDDLYKMYCGFANKQKWKVESIESRKSEGGGYSFVAFLVKGEKAFKYLKNEAGVHRVQRVPSTAKRGEVHTSTATVAALPETQKIIISDIPEEELEIETRCSGGPGGQHVNKTESAVRITHIPTGIVTTASEKSQHDNRRKALLNLRERLQERLQSDQKKNISGLRSAMIGTAERSEKIRTYNYPQNRVTDHRVKIDWHKLDLIIKGDLKDICQALINYEIEKNII
jgi:peptide chain release factor 1